MEPLLLSGHIINRAAITELAQSALPDAPVRPHRPRRGIRARFWRR